jgi:enamine deaminase RidA (YjgF/YER057c/UK114 family)
MENNKITQEELSQLQSVVEQYENVSFRIGQFTIEIESAKAERRLMIDQATQLLQDRNAVLETLEQKYGRDVKVNVQTGELVKNG